MRGAPRRRSDSTREPACNHAQRHSHSLQASDAPRESRLIRGHLPLPPRFPTDGLSLPPPNAVCGFATRHRAPNSARRQSRAYRERGEGSFIYRSFSRSLRVLRGGGVRPLGGQSANRTALGGNRSVRPFAACSRTWPRGFLRTCPSSLLKIRVEAGYGDSSMITLLRFHSSVWFMPIGRATRYDAVGAPTRSFPPFRQRPHSLCLNLVNSYRRRTGDKKCD
jgi:hypothetical protein